MGKKEDLINVFQNDVPETVVLGLYVLRLL